MYHFVFNVVVIGALAFMFLHDDGINLPTDFLRDHFAAHAVAAQDSEPKSSSAPSAQATAIPGSEPASPQADDERHHESQVARDTETAAAHDVAAEAQAAPPAPVAEPRAEAPAVEAAPAEPQPSQTAEPSAADADGQRQTIAAVPDTSPARLPPLEPPVTVSTLSPKTVPSPTREASGAAPAVAAPAQVQPAFMSHKDRRRELDRMIGELETFYLDRIAR